MPSVVATRPFQEMVEDHKSPQVRQISRAWTEDYQKMQKSEWHKKSVAGQRKIT